MRMLAAAALLALAGCYYDRPNPWQTAGDVADLQEMTERDYALLVSASWHPPQDTLPFFYDADLEAFRDTVLANASTDSLRDMREKSAAKLAWLQARQAGLLKEDELSRREQLREVNEQIRIEWIRGRMIQARLEAGNAGR
jgi:hypothetical protein